MNNAQMQCLANELFAYVAADAALTPSMTGGTASGAADLWVESYYADEPEAWAWDCTEEELMPIAEELIELLVARGIPRA